MNLIKYLIVMFTVATAFRVEINENIHTLCEILVYRPTYKTSQSLPFLNHALTDTVKHNSKVSFISVITDEYLGMIRINEEFSIFVRHRAWDNTTLHRYVSRKHTAGDSSTCSFTITTAYHMMTGQPARIIAEHDYSQIWGSWLRRSVQGSIGLLRLPSSHLLLGIVSVQEHRVLQLLLNKRDTIYMPPFLTYLVVMDAFGDVSAVKSTCLSGCSIARQIYQRRPVFSGHFNALIVANKPVSMRPRLILDYPWTRKHCTKSNCTFWNMAIPFVDLAAAFNYTLNLAPLKVDSSTPYDAVINVIVPVRFYVSSPTFLLSGDFKYIKARGSVPVYCSGKHKVEVINVLEVPLQSLDKKTWLVLAFSLICVYHYTRMTFRCNSKVESLFEIIEMLLQKTVRKQDFCRHGLLLGCFFIEFFYLSGTTESIIAPQRVREPETVLELFQTGHKWFQGAWKNVFSRDFIVKHKSEMEKMMLPDLQKEGFRGNQSDLGKFWVEDIIESDYPSTVEYIRAAKFVHQNIDVVYLIPANSIGLFKPNLEPFRHKFQGRDETSGCYMVKKVYGKQERVFYVYSAYRSILSPALDRLWQDSGIGFYAYKEKRSLSMYARPPVTSVTAKISLKDARTIAIFGLLSIGLTASIVCAAAENSSIFVNFFNVYIVNGILLRIHIFVDNIIAYLRKIKCLRTKRTQIIQRESKIL